MGKLEEYIIEAANPVGREQKGPFKRTRASEALTREQVKAIKNGRKLLRKEMRAKGLKEKSDFELTAANMGLYFDKSRWLAWLLWFFHGKGLGVLLGALLLLLLALFLFSTVTQLRGHFTINMSDGLFQEGFVLSETRDFANPVTHLFCTPAENVPCISIGHLPNDLDEIDGQHNGAYFAYTFYCRNEGKSTVGYDWQVSINSESKGMGEAAWVMIFEDGEMCFYAAPNKTTGREEVLPARGDNSRGYVGRPLAKFSKDPEGQYEIIDQRRGFEFSRVIPIKFVDDRTVAEGMQEGVVPGDIHKYTVVIWLEGDDPDCNDDLIGGHIGMEVFFQLMGEDKEADDKGDDLGTHWDAFWDNLKFWKG
ncbi:MAG: hypothetical protein E7444_04260 [Ruminococcaceae bacterium]|nr:hypothetical protein [Oscillospiraceae bacterium]